MTDSTDEPEHPGVVFPPPLLFVIGFGIGLLIDRQYPMFMNLNSGVICRYPRAYTRGTLVCLYSNAEL